ncbi:helix-turn-helix transcriptional regulator [Mucilaginibacter corticis]|uniref:Helix-turn-helix transcriptional regulator n=1 Tax=Mucilaginibacter corticis TaxID=2597670 RepID=A0A556MBV1_9SPHI|nr:helix-turn-helix transcriptional regulator [Mucilaginibacter corticis]TSJ37380.1 helix-turn-helix transcriptional regulator [Mucilaginibacter corticis]
MIKSSKGRRNEAAILILAQNVRKYRIAAGLTIMQLANKMDTDYSQIGRIERGLSNPSISTLFDLATALNIHPADLVEEEKKLD